LFCAWKIRKGAAWVPAPVPGTLGLGQITGDAWRADAPFPLSTAVCLLPAERAQCSSCWIFSVADTIAIAYGISTKVAGIAPGIQQFCDCSGMSCCSGGWPESSFAWFVANGNVTTRDAYTYWGQDGRTCAVDWTFPIAGKVQDTGALSLPPRVKGGNWLGELVGLRGAAAVSFVSPPVHRGSGVGLLPRHPVPRVTAPRDRC